jgi:amino acid adenylation domain-containing protein
MNGCIHQLFEAQSERSPAAIAVVYQRRELTYQELNCRANQLARVLKQMGVGPEVLVALYVERSLEMIVALLAVLKAGGAYVPMDTAYPQERLAFMLADANPRVVITQPGLRDHLPEHTASMICLDLDSQSAPADTSHNLKNETTLNNLAYVIYTSGSTGHPKGTLISHHNVVRLFQATHHWFGFGPSDVWTLFHSYAFDFSVWEMWGALLHGGKLVVVPFWLSRSPEDFVALLRHERVTVLNQTPSAFRQLMQAERAVGTAEALALRLVILGGEALQPRALRPWFARYGDQKPRIVNMYGITETTVHVTYRPLAEADLESGSLIGVPIPDMEMHLLDQKLQRVPVGVAGEIHVGGAGLARGYLHRPELTDAKFIPDPFDGDPGSRLYKSGDLARLLPNGDIEYLGRIDDQVKIRGFRVELEEIVSVLSRHPSVSAGIVVAREAASGDKHLVAYVTSDQRPAPSSSTLQAFMRQRLPDYMLPSAFVVLDRFPLTPNGKVDRRALPEPDGQRPNLRTAYLAPRNELERALTNIWKEVLQLRGIGVEDNFFDLGGQSLQLVRVHEKLQDLLGQKLPITTLLQFPTVRSLVGHLGQTSGHADVFAGIQKRAQRQRGALAHKAKGALTKGSRPLYPE